MHRVQALGVIIAIAAASPAPAARGEVTIDLGTFLNLGGGQIAYDGAFGAFIQSEAVLGADGADHTRIAIDLAGIVISQELSTFAGVSIIDTGANRYGLVRPGADIDYLALEGLAPETDVAFAYDGPNPVHQDEPAKVLARKLSRMDSLTREQSLWHYQHIALGRLGTLHALLSAPMPVDDVPTAQRPRLLLSEVGPRESFQVRVLAVVPGPGSLALLGVAALVALGRRRR